MYKAISYFKDMKDNMHSYNPGDIFPREGLSVSENRIKELSSANNLRGKPVIEFVEDKKVKAPVINEEPNEPAAEEKPKKKGKKKNAD